MKFSPKYGIKKLGMIYTISGSFCSLLNWKMTIIWPQIRPRKIPGDQIKSGDSVVVSSYFGVASFVCECVFLCARR